MKHKPTLIRCGITSRARTARDPIFSCSRGIAANGLKPANMRRAQARSMLGEPERAMKRAEANPRRGPKAGRGAQADC